MKKLRALTGLPVVCDGRRIGTLLRPELSEDLKRLKGIWFSAGLGVTRWIPAESLQMLGQVAVLADSRGERRRAGLPSVFRRATGTNGARLGAITGAEIDELSFAVTALELSRGLWDDLLTGRARVTRYTADPETGNVMVELSETTREAYLHEGRNGEGPDDGHAAGFGSGDGVRRDELEDRAELEPEREEDGQLDFQQGG